MRSLVLMCLAACGAAPVVVAPPAPSGKIDAYLGIPYAHAERWERSKLEPWAERDVSKRGPACPQPEEGFHRDTAEDCLNLNVWAPEGVKQAPVFVWIHGGAFYQGSGGDDLYDGARLAKKTGAVVVTINYRMGALGFISFAGKPMPALGLLDQRVALEWVKANIARFGGDPANVTIAGESAGGWSVCSQLAMPGSRGLFAKAMVMSGACSDALYKTPEEAQAQGDALMAAVGCTDLACMKGKSTDELVGALKFRRGLLLLPGVWWGPIVDGKELPKMPMAALRAGEAAKVPLMIGTAHDEGALHTMKYDTVAPDEFAWFARTTFGAAAEKAVVEKYASKPTVKKALNDVVSEGIFRCNARRVARIVSKSSPVYLYEWAHALNGPPFAHALGATHSIDIFFLFGMLTEGIGPDASEQPLVEDFQAMVGDFARTGAPGHGWPRYDAATDGNQVLDLPLSTKTGLDRDVCDFWDGLSRE